MRTNPGFTLLAVLVMALGIGANTAVFSVVNTVLLKPLAYREPDRIVTIRNFWKNLGATSNNVSAPDFHDWHDQSTVFEAMAAWDGDEVPVLSGSAAEYTRVSNVSQEFFDVFAIQPLLGREFRPEEHTRGSGDVAVISAAYWRSHFGGKPDAIGKTVRVAGRAITIVGVAPPGFDYPQGTAIWVPLNTLFEETAHRSAHNYRAVGRLKPDVTLDQARAQMSAIASRLEQLYPASNTNKGIAVDRMRDAMVSNVRLTLYLLLGAVGVVLLISCANVANLLLAKATARKREIAIRAAVGASRTRIMRQLIVESLVLAGIAGAAGVILAVWGVEAIKLLAPSSIPRLAETGVDASVLAFTLALSVVSALIFGLAPALAASRIDLNESLKQGAAKTVIGGGAGRLRAALVVAEIALSVMLLAGAGLLVRSFNALLSVNLGFRPEKILVAETSVPALDNAQAIARAVPFDKDMLAAMAAMPGVSAAGGTFAIPGNPGSDGGYWIDHVPPIEQLNVTAPQAVFSAISPGLLATLGIALKAGRDFDARDTFGAPQVVIINEALARQSFGGQDPIGRMLFCGFSLESLKGMRIIGVAGDVREYGPDKAPGPEILMPYMQHPRAAGDFFLLARTSADPNLLAEAVRRKIHDRDPEVPVKFTTMEAAVAQGVAAPRFRMALIALFAGVALCLAIAGVYGVMSYAMTERSGEIGLRMALGASSGDVLKLALTQGMALSAAGLVIGLGGAFASTRLFRSLLFEVKPEDPATYAAVAGVLALVALAACYIPARRASKVDPLVALRQE